MIHNFIGNIYVSSGKGNGSKKNDDYEYVQVVLNTSGSIHRSLERSNPVCCCDQDYCAAGSCKAPAQHIAQSGGTRDAACAPFLALVETFDLIALLAFLFGLILVNGGVTDEIRATNDPHRSNTTSGGLQQQSSTTTAEAARTSPDPPTHSPKDQRCTPAA